MNNQKDTLALYHVLSFRLNPEKNKALEPELAKKYGNSDVRQLFAKVLRQTTEDLRLSLAEMNRDDPVSLAYLEPKKNLREDNMDKAIADAKERIEAEKLLAKNKTENAPQKEMVNK